MTLRFAPCFAFVSCFMLLAGCDRGGEAQHPASQPASATATQKDEDDIQAARALPYAGGTEIGEDEDEGLDQAVFDPERMQPGYTLFSVHMRAMAKLIDEHGKVVKVWEDPGGRHWDNIELLPNGDLITTGADRAPVQGIKDEARYALRLNWDGKVVWKKYMHCHHDIAAAPNGELITLTFQRRRIPEINPRIDLRDDQITRLTMDGDVIESVSMYDTVTKQADLYPLEKNKPTSMGGRMWIDNFHLNSVEWMDNPTLAGRNPIYSLDNVLFCSRHQDRIAIMNMKKKRLVWAWGLGELDGPHDATMLDNGHILVFDNGLDRGWTRIVELDPLKLEIVWQYYVEQDKRKAAKYAKNRLRRQDESDRVFYTKSKGSNQRLANGNTLICNSDAGEIFEITPDGQMVWRYVSTERITKGGRELRAAFVRAYRYPHSFIDPLLKNNGVATGATPSSASP